MTFDPPFISHPVDSETGKTIGSKTYTIKATLLKNGVKNSITGFGNTIVPDKTSGAIVRPESIKVTDGVLYFNVFIYADKNNSNQATKATVTLTRPSAVPSTAIPWDTFEAVIPIVYAQRGIVGPAGGDGPLLYPAGGWDSTQIYSKTFNTDGTKVLTTPFVYYDPDNTGKGEYYVLEANSSTAGKVPANNTEWRPFKEIKYIFTEALMAKWARLAKAVFWGDYMFSAEGVNANGESIDYSAYAESMFTDGKLNGTIIPNLFLDLATGAAKAAMLSEPFNPMMKSYQVKQINPLEGHNITVGWPSGERYPKMILLPNIADDDVYYNGARCSIIVEAIPNQDIKSQYNWDESSRGIGGDRIVVVCADGRLSSMSSEVSQTKIDEKGWFSVGGRMAKFIIMEFGSMLQLRCAMTTKYNASGKASTIPIWYVENASDFEPTRFSLSVRKGSKYIYDFVCTEDTWYPQSAYIAMSTKYINSVRNTSKKRIDYWYDIDGNSNNEYGDGNMFYFRGMKE